MDKQAKRCRRCGKPASECLALGNILGSIAANGQCRVCNGQIGLGVDYEGPLTDWPKKTEARQ
jgi:hypothetical protein